MIRYLDAFVAWASKIMLLLGGLALVAMMAIACSNMVLRAVWLPVKGTFELMGFFGALVAAFALGSTQLAKGHIAVTVLEGVLPKGLERFINALGSLLSCAFFALACVETGKWSEFLRETGELSETLRIIYYPFTYAVAVGLGLLALALAADFLRQVLPSGSAGRADSGQSGREASK